MPDDKRELLGVEKIEKALETFLAGKLNIYKKNIRQGNALNIFDSDISM